MLVVMVVVVMVIVVVMVVVVVVSLSETKHKPHFARIKGTLPSVSSPSTLHGQNSGWILFATITRGKSRMTRHNTKGL